MLSLNTWDVAVALTNFDWTIFDSIHEVGLVSNAFKTVSAVSTTQPVILFHPIHVVLLQQELVYFTFSRHASSRHTVAFELLLQRCNEIQLWVMTEVLLCPMLCKRVQLIKKFIKIAAQ